MKPLWFALGWLSFALGVIGAFLPILPTTPFLILAAFLFSRSSPRVHAWLISLPFAGPSLQEWNEHRIVRPRAKILCTIMMAISLGCIWVFSALPLWGLIGLTILLLSVLSYVLSRSNGNDLSK